MRKLDRLKGEPEPISVAALREALRPYFSARPEILLAYVFGSVSAGRQNRLSDIDLAVLVVRNQYQKLDRQRPYGYQADALADLMGILKGDDVDLVILNRANPLLRHRAVDRGHVIFSRDEKVRINFEVQTLKEYLDTRPLRAIQAHYLRARIDRRRFGKVGTV